MVHRVSSALSLEPRLAWWPLLWPLAVLDQWVPIVIGFASGVICFLGATSLKPSLCYDDLLDAFGVHGVSGVAGCILTGIFVSESLGGQGLATGMAIGKQVGAQTISIIATIVYCSVLSFIILKIVDVIIGLRVYEAKEQEGLDLFLHGERGYDL